MAPKNKKPPTLVALNGGCAAMDDCVSEDRVNLLIAVAITQSKKEDRDEREKMHGENQRQFEELKRFMNRIIGVLYFCGAIGLPAIIADIIFRFKGAH